MYEYMSSHPEYMTSSNAEGVGRVENENYAFLMESTTIEYITERRCSLTQVGSLLDEKGYGIAMRKSKCLKINIQPILPLCQHVAVVVINTGCWVGADDNFKQIFEKKKMSLNATRFDHVHTHTLSDV